MLLELVDVELELLAVAEPVVIDADEDPDEELAELEPVDAVASMCVAELAESATALRSPALELEDQDTRREFTLALPELCGGQAAPGGTAGAAGALGGELVMPSRGAVRGGLSEGVVLGLPIVAWSPPVSEPIHAAPATPSERDSARAPTPVAMTRRRRRSRHVTAASMRAAILAGGE